MITDIYVSLLGENYIKLDLHKDESVLMKYTQKDLQDISKVFSPFSQDFTFPASTKNRQAFGFFGDTNVIKVNDKNKYFCKVYTNGMLSLTGFIILKDLKYVNGKPTDFSGGFATTMTNLKDQLGTTQINQLTDTECEIQWTPKEAATLLTTAKNRYAETSVAVSYFVPLISNKRVFGYDPMFNSSSLDNIAYNPANDSNSINLIKTEELRPCITFSTVIDLIIKKYNLDIICPLFSRPEYTDLMVWCTGETILDKKPVIAPILELPDTNYFIIEGGTTDVDYPVKYLMSSNITTNVITIEILNTDVNWENFCNLDISLNNVLSGSGDVSAVTGTFQIVNAIGYDENNPQIIYSQPFEYGSFEANEYVHTNFELRDQDFTAGEMKFYILIKTNVPISWGYMRILQNQLYGGDNTDRDGCRFGRNIYSNNSSLMNLSKLDLIKSLPKTKAVDFLTSFFKHFNISVFDTSPNNNKLYWLTPEDIGTQGFEYSHLVVDYTPYVDISSLTKSVGSDYNYYNFKHVTSKYKSNVDYLLANKIEYGQATYPLEKPTTNLKEFKVETSFSIIPPVTVRGTNDVITYYGFTNDNPTYLDTGHTRYKPNYDELTIFYNRGNNPLNRSFGVQSQTISGATINTALTTYMQVLPICYTMTNPTTSFAPLVILNIEYPTSLFLKYYKNQIARLLDPNALNHDYQLTLPSRELYLNESASHTTPTGFRLQNKIIVGENLFSIIDAQIDITTGKTKLTLLNY